MKKSSKVIRKSTKAIGAADDAMARKAKELRAAASDPDFLGIIGSCNAGLGEVLQAVLKDGGSDDERMLGNVAESVHNVMVNEIWRLADSVAAMGHAIAERPPRRELRPGCLMEIVRGYAHLDDLADQIEEQWATMTGEDDE